MSAIYGVIDFGKLDIEENSIISMQESYKDCCIDRYSYICEDNVAMGCGIQHFNTNLQKEILPFKDDNIFFTADAIVDNREELVNKYNNIQDVNERTTDAKLIYELIKNIGINVLDEILGAFAFVYYDKCKNNVIIGSDALGNRTVYYFREKGKLYFSSLIKPIMKVCNRQFDFNERFLCDFLSIVDLKMYTECAETPYEGIYRVEPWQVLEINKDNIIKTDYWKFINNIKTTKIKKRDELKKIWINTFCESVRCSIDTDGEIGILLSGGLDSTAVASFASKLLNEDNKLLYSFTSVPNKKYDINDNGYYMPDETKMVKITKEYLGNIEDSYIDLGDMNCWDERKKYIGYFESPCYSFQNTMWYDECIKEAKKKGCKVMLTGQYGNTTISFGDYSVNFNSLLRKAKIKRLINEINALRVKRKVSRKLIATDILNDNFLRRKNKNYIYTKLVDGRYVDKYNIEGRLRKHEADAGMTLNAYRKYMAYRTALRQIGESEMKLSLYTGIIIRDPTRDKRIIELSMQMPEDVFVKDGVERLVIKEFFRDYIPPHIIETSEYRKGFQSADMMLRLSENWNRIKDELKRDMKYCWIVDEDKVESLLNEYDNLDVNSSMVEIFKIFGAAVIGELVTDRNNKNNKNVTFVDV